MDTLFLCLYIVGIVVALAVGYLQFIVPFVKGEVKFSRKWPFVIKAPCVAGTEFVRGRKRAVGTGKKSIVVLPFDNLGKTEDDYFAAGVTEEITSRLAAINGLAVISRTSANQYVNTKKTIAQIGEELGVDYVLEGSVRWARAQACSDRVRITPQLIRVSDDSHLWADSYDRDIEDIFQIQTDIAQTVIEQLDLRLIAREREAVEAKLTADIDAYHAYLRARYFTTRPHFSVEYWSKAIDCAEEAVRIDPGFVAAYVELTKSHSILHYYWYDHTEQRRNKAKAALGKALRLAPRSPYVRVASACYHLYCYRDTERAGNEIEMAERELPDSDEVLQTKAYICQIRGRWDEAIELLEHAYGLSPRDVSLPVEVSFILWLNRRFPEALAYAEEASTLAPDDAWPYLYKVFISWAWKGDGRGARGALERVPKEHAWAPWVWFWQEMFEGNYEAGIDRLDISAGEWIRIKIHASPKCMLAGLACRSRGDKDGARVHFERARTMLESEVRKFPDDPRYHSSLGIVYAATGQKEKAIKEGKKAAELLPLAKDAMYGIPYVEDLSTIYSLAGEPEAALEQLEHLLSIASWITVPWIEMNPRWQDLRGQPGYSKLLDKYR